MIVRRWTATVDVARLEEYETFVREFSVPMFQRQRGLRGVVFLTSASGDEQTAVTLWDDLGAIEALDSSHDYLSTAHALVESGMVVGTPVTQVWLTTALPYFFRS